MKDRKVLGRICDKRACFGTERLCENGGKRIDRRSEILCERQKRIGMDGHVLGQKVGRLNLKAI